MLESLAAGYNFLGAGEPALALRCFDRVAPESAGPELHAARAEAWEALAHSGQEELPAWNRAIDAWTEAVAGAPDCVAYRLGLGEAQLAVGSLDAACATFAEIVRLRPDSVRAQLGQGRVMAQMGDLPSAIIHYREAIHIDGSSRDALFELGLLMIDNQQERDGIAILERCARLYPEDGAVLYHLGRAWHGLLEDERARGFLARCLQVDPDDPLQARLLLDRIDEEEQARRAGEVSLPPEYVRALFDQYADHFDDELRSRLGYHAPDVLRRLSEPLIGGLNGELDVLDLGCGTGLSGEPFRPCARYLCGVDLSPAMIQQAEGRGIYDRLQIGDIRAALAEGIERWDLIVACDALVYLADLREVLIDGFRVLRPGGWFVATVEAPESEEEIHFKRTRRFGHSEAYLRQIAGAAGFDVRTLQPSQVRQERGRPVPGFAFVFVRPDVARKEA
ncbi:MAG: methyltransferase domain-containing protein [Candidatus Eisenbacteria bacterium]|uniref:Methyltransferase domain-containing protein n=1 Tax=Eiseniibacteriota bacterium TaxID=2212470 RepID=A0A956RM89_UNCEI|nr:methyltransferase domain-containing protein [Candidatus Eisenbacteria bacterium]